MTTRVATYSESRRAWREATTAGNAASAARDCAHTARLVAEEQESGATRWIEIANSPDRPDVVTVTASGFHRPGQMLRCDGSNRQDTLVPYDAPCITKLGMGWVTPEPATPDSVVGVKNSPGDAGGFGPRKLLTGYLAPDGTHYPCEAWGHRAAALSVCRDRGFKREPLAADDWRAAWVDESSDDPLDPEQELDRRSFVRIQSDDRDDSAAVQFFASHYDTAARLTDAQKTWLRVHGYKRQLRRTDDV